MTGWHLAHLIALGLWGGIVLAEGVVEVIGTRSRAGAKVAAEVHHWIDLCCEAPVLLGVLLTGAVLAWTIPETPLHWVKLALGLFAVGVNFWCLGVVVRRHRRFEASSDAEVAAETRRVFLAIKLGLPAASAALYLGLRLQGWV